MVPLITQRSRNSGMGRTLVWGCGLRRRNECGPIVRPKLPRAVVAFQAPCRLSARGLGPAWLGADLCRRRGCHFVRCGFAAPR